jgi:hypothetical protein
MERPDDGRKGSGGAGGPRGMPGRLRCRGCTHVHVHVLAALATRRGLGIKTNRRRNTASCPAGPAAFGAAGRLPPIALCRRGCVGAPAFACTCWPCAHVTLASSPFTHQAPAARPLTAAIIAAILSRHQCRRPPPPIGPGLLLRVRACWLRLPVTLTHPPSIPIASHLTHLTPHTPHTQASCPTTAHPSPAAG